VDNLRFLFAPLRFVWCMMIWVIVLFLSPLIVVGVLVFGTGFMSADEIDWAKVLLVVVGPFAFVFWWITIRHVSSRHRAKHLIASRNQTGDDYSEAELRFLEYAGKPKHLRNVVVLAVSLAASLYCAHLFYHAGDPQFFLGVIAGILSPAIMITIWNGSTTCQPDLDTKPSMTSEALQPT
jgi:hypothetical protein